MDNEEVAVEEVATAPSKQKLEVGREDLQAAVTEGMISEEQADDLWRHLASRQRPQPAFDLANLAWYSGAVIVMIAMGWFLTEMWEWFAAGGIFVTASAYGLFFLMAGKALWSKSNLKVPGGVLVTLAVFMVPLAVFGLEAYLDQHKVLQLSESYSVLLMELATVAAGLTAIYFFRFPFITAPLSVAIWLAGMELIKLSVGHDLFWEEQRLVTIFFGLVMIAGSYVIDLRVRDGDFAFWGYLIGASAFWLALTFSGQDSELDRFVYCLVNVGLMLGSVLLDRRIFVIYGGIGVIGYLSHLAFTVFAGSAMFPFALSLMGLGIIYLGIQYHRHRDAIVTAIVGMVPEGLRDWIPAAHR